MKKKLGDFTLSEIKGICAKLRDCTRCPFGKDAPFYGILVRYDCLIEKIAEYLPTMENDMEIEIEEEKE